MEGHKRRFVEIAKTLDLLGYHLDRMYKHAKKYPEYSLEIPRRPLDMASEILRSDFGSDLDVLSLARVRAEADPEVKKDYPDGIPDEHLRIDASDDVVRISGRLVPLYAYLYHLKDTLHSVHAVVARRLGEEYLRSVADLFEQKGLPVDLEDLRSRIDTMYDARELYLASTTAPEWFWDYVKMHGLRPLDVAEHLVHGRDHRDFWDLLDKHPELRTALHPDFASRLSGKKRRKTRDALVSRKQALKDVDPRSLGKAIRALGISNVLRVLTHPEIPAEQVADVLSRDRPMGEIEHLLRILGKYRSLDAYSKHISKNVEEDPRRAKILSLYEDHSLISAISKRLPKDLAHLLSDPAFIKAFAKEYERNEDLRRAIRDLPDTFDALPVREALHQYSSTGNPLYIHRALVRLSEYGKILRRLPEVREPIMQRAPRNDAKWEHLIMRDPIYRPLLEELERANIDLRSVLGDLVHLVRSAAGDDLAWARNPKNARKIFDIVRRHILPAGGATPRGTGDVRVHNQQFYAGAAAEAISRLFEYLGDAANVWKNPKGHVVISLRGLKDHDATFVAKIPDYLQKASGVSVPMYLGENAIRIPRNRLPDVISALKRLEGILRGDSRKNVRRFRRMLEGYM